MTGNNALAATRRPSRIEQLPEEILLEIFQHTLLSTEQLCKVNVESSQNPRQACSLGRVCRLFCRIVQPLVYQTLSVTCDSHEILHRRQLKRFNPLHQLEHLRLDPEAGPLVRHVVLKGSSFPEEQVLAALEDPIFQSFVGKTYSPEFCVFLNRLIRDVRYGVPNLFRVGSDALERGYDLFIIYSLSLAVKVEFVSLFIFGNASRSMAARFFQFCRQSHATNHQSQAASPDSTWRHLGEPCGRRQAHHNHLPR